MKKKKYKKRKDGRYATTVTIGRDIETGKPIKVFVYGHTIDELKNNVLEVKLKKRQGFSFSTITFKEYKEKWYEKKKLTFNKNSANTIVMYDGILNKYFPTIDYLKLKDITSHDIQKIITENKDKKRTCQNIRMVLNQIFKSAISERIIQFNPMDNVTIPKHKAKEKRPLTPDEDYLSEIADFSDMENAFIKLIKYFGLRREEALALTKNDFDFEKDLLHINKACTFVKGEPILKDTKNTESRFVPIPQNVKSFFIYYLSNIKFDMLFTRKDGSLLKSGTYQSMWKTIKRKMNMAGEPLGKKINDDLSAHIFRHNYACILMYAGIEMKERQYLLGHKDIKMTMNIYTHIEETKLESPQRLSDYFLTTSIFANPPQKTPKN